MEQLRPFLYLGKSPLRSVGMRQRESTAVEAKNARYLAVFLEDRILSRDFGSELDFDQGVSDARHQE